MDSLADIFGKALALALSLLVLAACPARADRAEAVDLAQAGDYCRSLNATRRTGA